MKSLKERRAGTKALLEDRDRSILELQRKLQASEARIEDMTDLLSRQQSALVAKDQEIIYLRSRLRDLMKGGNLCDP